MREIEQLRSLRQTNPNEFNKLLHELDAETLELLSWDWELLARDKQLLPEGDWTTWLILAGRGFGKTRTGAETVRLWVKDNPLVHLVAATASDARDVMVEGESGILAIHPKHERPVYEPSKRRLTWPNGAKGVIYSAEEPDRLRGPQCYKAWADELAAWQYEEAWDQLRFGMRLGKHPQCVVTTTPKPTKIIRELVKDESTYITKGSTYENRSNLAKTFFDQIIKKYEGTTLGRQELEAEILEDVEGALWNRAMIENNRVKAIPEFRRIVVAIDPAVSNNKDSNETGIVVCGIANNGVDDIGYILKDRSGIYSPKTWATIAIEEYNKWNADRIIGEVNNGGDLIETILRDIDKKISYKGVRASKGKVTRAEPVAALYEQSKVKHYGTHAGLEDQMTTWNHAEGEKSPDRIDALVWGLTELMLKPQAWIR